MKTVLKRSLIVAVIAVLALSTVFLCACNKYNSTFLYDVDDYMNEEFLVQNRTLGAAYFTEEYVEELDEYMSKAHYVTDAPKTRDIIVDSEEKFSEIFSDFPIEINFEKEMLVLHMYTDIYPRPVYMQSISLKDGNLKVVFRMKPNAPGYNDATMPGQCCVAVKMDKKDIQSVEFIKKD